MRFLKSTLARTCTFASPSWYHPCSWSCLEVSLQEEKEEESVHEGERRGERERVIWNITRVGSLLMKSKFSPFPHFLHASIQRAVFVMNGKEIVLCIDWDGGPYMLKSFSQIRVKWKPFYFSPLSLTRTAWGHILHIKPECTAAG